MVVSFWANDLRFVIYLIVEIDEARKRATFFEAVARSYEAPGNYRQEPEDELLSVWVAGERKETWQLWEALNYSEFRINTGRGEFKVSLPKVS